VTSIIMFDKWWPDSTGPRAKPAKSQAVYSGLRRSEVPQGNEPDSRFSDESTNIRLEVPESQSGDSEWEEDEVEYVVDSEPNGDSPSVLEKVTRMATRRCKSFRKSVVKNSSKPHNIPRSFEASS
jgi:hypothetical protein